MFNRLISVLAVVGRSLPDMSVDTFEESDEGAWCFQWDGGLDGVCVQITKYRNRLGKDSFRFDVTLPGGDSFDLAGFPREEITDKYIQACVAFLRVCVREPQSRGAQDQALRTFGETSGM